MSSATAANEVMEYSSPEFAAVPKPTVANDQYALGAIGYFALSGAAPFPEMGLADRLAAKQAGPPTPLDAVNYLAPRELSAVLDRMLQPIPANRFANLEEAYGRPDSRFLAYGRRHDDCG